MTKALLIGLVALAVSISAAALAWRSWAPPRPGEPAAAAPVTDAPSSRAIFPKVLNR